MRLRSGIEFVPYYLKSTFRPQTPLENPISTLVNVDTLIQDAVAREDARQRRNQQLPQLVTSEPNVRLMIYQSYLCCVLASAKYLVR